MPSSELPAAVAYYRCSTAQQDTSIAAQRELVRRWAEGRYKIVAEYVDEGRSGSKDTRKRMAFLRMIDDLTSGKYRGQVRVVVCLNLDRFGRLDTLSGAEHKAKLRDARVILDMPMDGRIDWSRSIDRIVDSVKSEAAHATSLTIGEKGLAGRIKATLAGRPNQTTPYGMHKLCTPPGGEPVIVPRGRKWRTPRTWHSVFAPGLPAEAEAVKTMFKTYDEEDVSYAEVARRLALAGYPEPTCEGWQGQMIGWMLGNPVYAGGLIIGREPKGKFFHARAGESVPADGGATPSPVVAWDKHEGLVSRELWDRVQAKMARRTGTRRPPRNAGPYALSGVLYCGQCGRPMYGSRAYWKHGKADGGRAVVYRCHRAELGVSPCGYWVAYDADLLPLVLERFLPDLLSAAREMHAAGVAASGRDDEGERLRRQLEETEARLATGRERYLAAPQDMAAGLLATLRKWEAEKAELEARLSAGPARAAAGLPDAVRQAVEELLAGTRIDLGGGGPGYTLAAAWEGEREQARDYADAWRGPSCHLPHTMKAAALRERLKRLGVRVDVWFNKRERRKGWNLSRVRVEADGHCGYEYAGNAAS